MVTTEQVLDWVRAHPLPDGRIIPVCLWGTRGVGKTAWVGGYCKQRQFGFRVYYPAHDTTGSDIVGMARIDPQIDRTIHARPMWLPSKNDPVVFEQRGVLFIDELNRAPRAVLRGLMEPLGEGRIEHSGWKLPPAWGFVCAANPPEAGYDVDMLDEALMNRLLHIPMGFDATRWAAWAGETQVHPDLVGFTAMHAENLIANARPQLPEAVQAQAQATPRSVEYLARMYEPEMDRSLLQRLSEGLIGVASTESFLSYLDAPERPVTAENILAGQFSEKLIAHKTAGREDLLEASITLLLAALVRYGAHPDAADRVAAYLQLLGEARVPLVWARIVSTAPHWTEALHSAWKRQEDCGSDAAAVIA